MTEHRKNTHSPISNQGSRIGGTTLSSDTWDGTPWSRNKEGDAQGVFSLQTALDLWELSDVNPAKIHMTVPVGFRKRAEAIPKAIKLHRKNLKSDQVVDFHGMKITTPLQTLLDVIEDGSLSPEFVKQALNQARDRGLILEKDVWNQPRLQKYLRKK